MINDLALPTSEGAHVTFKHLQLVSAPAVNLEGPELPAGYQPRLGQTPVAEAVDPDGERCALVVELAARSVFPDQQRVSWGSCGNVCSCHGFR